MIVDTSAIVAVLADEPERERLLAALLQASSIKISAATLVELGIVVDRRRDPRLSRRLDELLAELAVEVVAVDAAQASTARGAYRDYGKGSGHPAALNLGDCFSYALASVAREPLLFVGHDFVHTDLEPA